MTSLVIMLLHTPPDICDHTYEKTSDPARSRLFKLVRAGLVLKPVTIGEPPVLHVAKQAVLLSLCTCGQGTIVCSPYIPKGTQHLSRYRYPRVLRCRQYRDRSPGSSGV